MRLESLVSAIDGARLTGGNELAICGLACDSRKVRDGFVFAALAGAQDDGRGYVDDAVARGAVAILAQEKTSANVPHILSANPRATLARVAERFFAYMPDKIAAVTGTNGKSSCVGFVRALCTQCGFAAASLGTLGVERDGARAPLALTTPDPVTLHAALRDLHAGGTTHLALEASSHGLAQARLDGLHLCAAGFTNLSRDHLDYHADMEAYFAAKMRLFTDILPPDGVAIIHIGDAYGARLAEELGAMGRRVMAVGGAAASLTAETQPDSAGQNLILHWDGEQHRARLNLLGQFQTDNLLVALGLSAALGCPRGALIAGIEQLRGAEGRMQSVGISARGASILVDYAHTPGALERVLSDLAAHKTTDGRLITVFGCGGERDTGKRAPMGEVAARLSARVFVTDDNPRGEDAAAIRAQIMAACPEAVEIGERGAAIEAAIMEAAAGDIVLVAGKGHEQGQIIGEVTHSFKDAEIIAAILEEEVRA